MFGHSNKYYQLYSEKSEYKKLKNEGVYIFGGRNNQGKLNNNLYTLNIFTKPI